MPITTTQTFDLEYVPVECGECRDNFPEYETVDVNGTLYCVSCGERTPGADTITNDDGDIYCQTCYYDNYTTCCRCDREVVIDNALMEDGDTYCERCHSEMYASCNDCSRIIDRDDACYTEWDDGPYCENCYMERESESTNLHNYSYSPTIVFRRASADGCILQERNPYRDTLYLGIELECDPGSNDAVRDILERIPDTWWGKEDGSLPDTGMELCAQPATLDVLSADVRTVCDILRSHRTRAWDCKDCGLHVHVGRNAFADRQSSILTATLLVFRSEEKFQRLVGRTSGYASFDKHSADSVTKAIAAEKKRNSRNRRIREQARDVGSPERYTAVNVQPRYTIEFRLFRPSTKAETVIAALECAHAIVSYSLTITAHDCLQGDALAWDTWRTWVAEHKLTYPHLNARIAYRLERSN